MRCIRLAVLIFISYFSSAGAHCPHIITRQEWDARKGTSESLETHPATHVIIHHSGTPTCTTEDDCSAAVKSLQMHHIRFNRRNDIGYNFLVGEDGNVYEGVGWSKAGSHAQRYNKKSIGICIIGDYTSRLPNDVALTALKDLIDCGIANGDIRENYRLLGHRQIEVKMCPGTTLYQHIKDWQRWGPY